MFSAFKMKPCVENLKLMGSLFYVVTISIIESVVIIFDFGLKVFYPQKNKTTSNLVASFKLESKNKIQMS